MKDLQLTLPFLEHADGNSAWKIDIITGCFFLKKQKF